MEADLKKKNSSLLFCICRKNKADFVAYPQEEKQDKERLFYCLKGGMQNVEVRNNKKIKFGGKIIWYTMKKVV